MHDKVYEDIAQDKTSIIYSENAAELLELQSNNFVENKKNALVESHKVSQ
jgi:fibrillarin-like rRNA methylase